MSAAKWPTQFTLHVPYTNKTALSWIFAKWQWLRNQRTLGKDQKPWVLPLVPEILSVLNFRHLHLREEVEVNPELSNEWVLGSPPSLDIYHKPSYVLLDRSGWSWKQIPLGRERWGHASSLCLVVLIEPQVNFLRSQRQFHVPEGTGEVCETRWEVGSLFPELVWLLFRPWSRIELFVVIKYPVAGSWNRGYTKKKHKKIQTEQNKNHANFSSIQNPGKKKINVYKIKINGVPKFNSLVSNTTREWWSLCRLDFKGIKTI